MKVSTSSATWQGNLREGQGTMKLTQGNYEGPFSFLSRFEQGKGTSPEEMLGAAHAGCYSMALTATLNRAGFNPEKVATEAKVYLDTVGGAPGITKVELSTEVTAPGLDDKTFQELAEDAKKNCVISRALGGVADIQLSAKLA